MLWGGLDPNALGIHELAQAEVRKLPPIAALLDAPDGNSWVGRAEAVDEASACLEPPGYLRGLPGVGRPQRAAEAIVAGIGEFDRVLEVVCDADRGDRSEGLLVESGHAW